MKHLAFILLAIAGVSAATSEAGASWSFGRVHLGNIGIDGAYAGRIPLEPGDGESADVIPFLTHRLTLEGGRVKSVIAVEGLKTFLSITEREQAVWRSPCGVEVRQRIGDVEGGTTEALARVYYSEGGRGLVATRDGWRFLYLQGALVRAISPQQFVYRCRTRGPWIEEISPLGGGPLKALVRARYADNGRLNSVAVGGNDYVFVYSEVGAIVQVYRNGRPWLKFDYENLLLAKITGDAQHEGALKWQRAPGYRLLTRMINPSGYLLKSFRGESYEFSMTQSTIRLKRMADSRTNTLKYNLYTEAVTYE